MAKPPMYGDYEAQRHWMEVTINLNSQEWWDIVSCLHMMMKLKVLKPWVTRLFFRYMNTSDNNLEYWGIDYPPLSAYQSLASGHFLQLFDENAVMLHSSRGYESPLSKLGMRLSVVVWDLLSTCWKWVPWLDRVWVVPFKPYQCCCSLLAMVLGLGVELQRPCGSSCQLYLYIL